MLSSFTTLAWCQWKEIPAIAYENSGCTPPIVVGESRLEGHYFTAIFWEYGKTFFEDPKLCPGNYFQCTTNYEFMVF